MDPLIFRENDIRGRVGVDIALSEVSTLAHAVGTFFRRHSARKIVVGRDTRPTSRAWLREVIRGLTASGCDVVDVGSCLTPCLQFAVRHLGADAGVMVTASHNAIDYNGLKLMLGTEMVHSADLHQISRIVDQGDFIHGQGGESEIDVTEAYVAALAADLRVTRPLRVGIDAGHGTAGRIAAKLFDKLGVQTYPLRPQSASSEDGHFVDPAHPDDLEPLSRFVRAAGLDLGFAFDGDGDRLGVVRSSGAAVPADDLLIVFARSLLESHPGAAIVGEVLCSQRLFDEVARLGGRPIMWKTGHSLVREKMAAEGALLAGELSGHFFFVDRYPAYNDAIYAAGRLLEIVAASAGSLSHLPSGLPPVARFPQMRIPCSDAMKLDVMSAATQTLREIAAGSGAEITEIDGLRVVWPDAWAVVRASNTEPAIVVRCEAKEETRLRSVCSLTLAVVNAALEHHGVSRHPGSRTNGDERVGDERVRELLGSRPLAPREP